MICRAENATWTEQEPGQSTMSRPVCLITQRPSCWSGAKMIGWPSATLRTIRSALLDVQMMSLSAFTAALQLI